MDMRAEKLAKARKKLRDHQEKKVIITPKDDMIENSSSSSIGTQNVIAQKTPQGKVEDLINTTVNPVTYNELKTDTSQNDLTITQILISDKTILESKIKDLNSKIMHLELLPISVSEDNRNLKDKINFLQSDLTNITKALTISTKENSNKELLIEELREMQKKIIDEKNNLLEQLEVTKTMLTTKEAENIKLQKDIHNYHNQLETANLQIQQLTNDTAIQINHATKNSQDAETMLEKISSLQQQIQTLQKERDHNNSHYNHYVSELNEQLKAECLKKENYYEELQGMYQRESSLIEQISEMEIRLQNYNNIKEKTLEQPNIDLVELEEKLKTVQVQLEEEHNKYNSLEKEHNDCLNKIKELSEIQQQECNHDNISISQLNADITSDKIAAQKAVEQNKKLKHDIEDLEVVVVKMTKDKLELTEMLNHEKSLNKDLILKLTEIEESTKNINTKLKAKDEEMMRLQSGYRDIEMKHGKLLKDLTTIKETTSMVCQNENNNNNKVTSDQQEQLPEEMPINNTEHSDMFIVNNTNIPTGDAMEKLQERFLKIMNEVANLSDEKHRLEHIILQLQNETDTICEYVALYQQQRSLLKKREEERNNQISAFQKECEKLKHQLQELSDKVLHILDDEKLVSHLNKGGKNDDIARIKQLLHILQNNSLLDTKFNSLDLNMFYPCSCCSGQLIDV